MPRRAARGLKEGVNFRETWEALGEEVGGGAMGANWEASEDLSDDLGRPPGPDALAEARAFVGLPAELDNVLAETASAVAASPALNRLYRHACYCAFVSPEPPDIRDWPELRQALGKRGRVFYLLVALASVPLTRRRHRKLRVSRAVTRATCRDIAFKSERSALSEPDRPGLHPMELNWIWQHVRGQVFTLGRLQYRRIPYAGGAEVFRNDTEDLVLAFAPPDFRYDARGLLLHDHEPLPPGGWASRLTVGEGDIRGHPISPRGFVLPREATIPAGLWRRVLSIGDPVLHVHVPSGGGITPETCLASLKEADRFFRRIFRGRLFRAFVSHSWLLGPFTPDVLPADSNIRRMREQLYLYPCPRKAHDGFRFLFGPGVEDPRREKSATTTSLQRAVLEHLERGGEWGNGGMFFLPEDLPRYGQAPYRKRWAEIEKRLEDL